MGRTRQLADLTRERNPRQIWPWPCSSGPWPKTDCFLPEFRILFYFVFGIHFISLCTSYTAGLSLCGPGWMVEMLAPGLGRRISPRFWWFWWWPGSCCRIFCCCCWMDGPNGWGEERLRICWKMCVLVQCRHLGEATGVASLDGVRQEPRRGLPMGDSYGRNLWWRVTMWQ